MSKSIPRKIKKACKSYRNYVPLKTKWLRYVYNQISGRVNESLSYVNNWVIRYRTKNGEILDEYILLGNNIKYRKVKSTNLQTTLAEEKYQLPISTYQVAAPALKKTYKNIILDTYSRPSSWNETFFDKNSSRGCRFKGLREVDFTKTSKDK